MEQNKKQLLLEQANKIADIINVLSENFDEIDVEDEVNFLSIVKSNLCDWIAKS